MSTAPKMPEWLEPMAATLTEERFSGPDWLFERKFDGIRLLAYKRGGDVGLFSRNRLPQHLPAVSAAIARLPVDDVILDGEMTWDGRSGYHVFDILWLDGRDVTPLPLEERRALLESAAVQDAACTASSWLDERQAVGAGLPRGLGRRDREAARIAVRTSPLEALAEDEVRGVAGAGRRRVHRSAGRARRAWGAARRLLRGDDFVFAGKVGTGFDTKLLLDLRKRFDTIEQPTPPFTKGTGLPRVRAALGAARDCGAGLVHRMDRRTASCVIRG